MLVLDTWQSPRATLRFGSLLVTPMSPNRCLPSAMLTVPPLLIRSVNVLSPNTFKLQVLRLVNDGFKVIDRRLIYKVITIYQISVHRRESNNAM